MGQRFIRETVYRDLIDGDPAHMTQLVTLLVESPEDKAVFVSTSGNDLTGMIGLFVYLHPMSGKRTAVEVFWWTEPEHRGHGLRLLRAATQWATAAGATQLQMIAPTAEIERLYTRLGFTKIETSYGMEL